MKQNAQADKPFSLYQHVFERLMQWDQLIDQRLTGWIEQQH